MDWLLWGGLVASVAWVMHVDAKMRDLRRDMDELRRALPVVALARAEQAIESAVEGGQLTRRSETQ